MSTTVPNENNISLNNLSGLHSGEYVAKTDISLSRKECDVSWVDRLGFTVTYKEGANPETVNIKVGDIVTINVRHGGTAIKVGGKWYYINESDPEAKKIQLSHI